MENAGRSGNGLKTVDRALTVLELVGADADGLTMNEIAGSSGLSKPTVWRFVRALHGRGYIKKDPGTGRYKLGLKILNLTSQFLQSVQFREVAVPYLRRLQEMTGETVNLAVLDEGEVIYIERRESPSTMRAPFLMGKRAPAFCTALGRSMLAYMSPEDALRILSGSPRAPRTPKTVTDINEIISKLQEVRRQGIAFDDEEHQMGNRCIGAPIFDITGKVLAAISVTGSLERLSPDRIPAIVEIVKDVASSISAELGWRPLYPGT